MKRFTASFLFIALLVPVAAFGQNGVSEKNVRTHLAKLASTEFEGRRTGEPGIARAADYIEKEFKKYGLKPGVAGSKGKSFRQEFSFTPTPSPGQEKKTYSATNIVGVVEGRDANLKGEAIVIGAHYDHLGRGGPGSGSLAANSTDIHFGADDNASGTTALLELARLYAKAGSNKRTLIFVAFSGEELGLFGSKHYADNPVIPVERTVAMFNMDMVGRLTEDNLTVGGIGSSIEWKSLVEGANSSLAPKTAAEGSVSGFKLRLDEAGVGPSDHASFYLKKIPVLFFFTGTHADYHKPSDTFDKVNYAGLLSIANFVKGLVDSVDSNPKRPTYKDAPAPQMGGRRTFNVSIGVMPGYGDDGSGMVIDGVTEGRPAAAAGLKAGDKIVSFAGKEIKNVNDYMNVLGELVADKEVDIVVVRGGERMTFKVKPAKR